MQPILDNHKENATVASKFFHPVARENSSFFGPDVTSNFREGLEKNSARRHEVLPPPPPPQSRRMSGERHSLCNVMTDIYETSDWFKIKLVVKQECVMS